jgi:hypothetical protein
MLALCVQKLDSCVCRLHIRAFFVKNKMQTNVKQPKRS